jgi:hypothetical protein
VHRMTDMLSDASICTERCLVAPDDPCCYSNATLYYEDWTNQGIARVRRADDKRSCRAELDVGGSCRKCLGHFQPYRGQPIVD